MDVKTLIRDANKHADKAIRQSLMNIYLREIYELCAQLDPPLDPIKDKQYFVSVLDEIQRVAVEGLNERSIDEQ